MKHKLRVSQNGFFFTVTTEGDGDVAGIIAFLNDIINHPQWQPDNYVLLDHRALKIDQISSEGIEEVSAYFISITEKLGNGRIALVMQRDIDFGIARVWEMVTEFDVGISIRVFRKYDEAIDWLNN